MDFNKYQVAAAKYDTFEAKPEVFDPSFVAKIFGLSGETGEVCEKFKKILRDKHGKLSPEDKSEIVKELGDVLWYLAAISRYMGVEFEKVVPVRHHSPRRPRQGRSLGSGRECVRRERCP